MKKVLTIVMLLAVMGAAMAQLQGQKEYVSVLVTFNDTNMLPQDSLNKYGVFIQTRSGRMATALIDASKYQMFLNAQLVERVQPSTRVILRDEQLVGSCGHKAGQHHKHDHKDCHGHKCQHDSGMDTSYVYDEYGELMSIEVSDGHGNVQKLDPVTMQPIPAQDNHGWYLGLVLGGASNAIDAALPRWDGEWYTGRGIELELRAGYQINEWFGIRSGLQLLSKDYHSVLDVKYLDIVTPCETDYSNYYLQLPVMADFAVGGDEVRIHFMAGGFAGYWLSQWRHGYVYKHDDPRPFVGDAYSFEEGFDNRFEAGLAAGIGLELRVAPAWRLHFEGNYYHGLVSTAKAPYATYNRTTTFGLGLTYQF